LANGNLSKLGVAWDSRALLWEALVEEEREIIKNINALVKKIQQDNAEKSDDDKKRWDKKHPCYPWAKIEKHRCHRIIMLYGMRGAGKTSLMLTLLNGWLSPSEYGKDNDAFEGMDKVIKPLPPLDFDSLPPDLPLYNWIIQCFGPVVDKLTGSKQQDGFLGDYENGSEKSLRQRFRDLQQAAAIGWTAGMLKNQMSSGMDDFLLWQDQQQTDWQKLQNNWLCFLDEMFKQLEKSDLRFAKDALIAISIDDLDLQPSRLRELLLVLRSFHHDRLVYFLNGDMENLTMVLETEYYLSYIQNGAQFNEERLDKIEEQTAILAKALIDKAVPKSHRFSLSGLNLTNKNAMEWTPELGAKTLGQILNNLDSDFALFIKNKDLLNLLKDRVKIPFRALQQFFNQHHQSENSNKRIEGIREFLEVVFTRAPNEENIYVNLSEDGETIEISESKPGYFAPAPYDYDSYSLTRNVTLHCLRSVEFANIKSNPDSEQNGRLDTNPADPALLMALELAAHHSDTFKFINGPRPTSRTFGFVWTQLSTSKGQIIFTWPYSEQLKSPREWKEKVKEWNRILDIYIKSSSSSVQEKILKAWCCFIMNESPSQLEEKSLADFIGEAKLHGYSDVLLPLASKYSGLRDKEREEIAKVLELKDINIITKSGLDFSYWWETTFPIPMDPYDFAALLLKNTDEQKILEAIKTLLIEDIQLPNTETEAKESEENNPSDSSKKSNG
jgi:hypothetical protein